MPTSTNPVKRYGGAAAIAAAVAAAAAAGAVSFCRAPAAAAVHC